MFFFKHDILKLRYQCYEQVNLTAADIIGSKKLQADSPIGKDSTEGWLVKTTEVVGGTETRSPLGAPDIFNDKEIGADRPGIWTWTFCRPWIPWRPCNDAKLKP